MFKKIIAGKLFAVMMLAAMVVAGPVSISNAAKKDSPMLNGISLSLIEEPKDPSISFNSIGIIALYLNVLDLWSDVPNPDFDVWATGLQVEGENVEILLGYASTKSHPQYKQQVFFGSNYLLIKEKNSRIGTGILAEFKFDENFNLPQEASAPVYQLSSTIGFGLKIVKNLWVYVDTYIYKINFSRERIYGLSLFEIGIPIMPRVVWKF